MTTMPHDQKHDFLGTFATLVENIGRHLPNGPWYRQPTQDEKDGVSSVWGQHWQRLDGPDGAELSLTWRDGRVGCSGQYPQHDGHWYRPRDEAERPPTITMSSEKDASAMARDIARRVLPRYLATLPGQRAALREYIDGRAETRKIAHQVAALLDARPPRSEDRPEFTFYGGGEDRHDVIKVDDANDGRHIRVQTGRLTMAQFKAVLAVLNGG